MRTTAFVLFASSLVASAQESFVPGSSKGCIAGRKCVEAIKLSASKEIELFIGKDPVFEVYPGRAVSVKQLQIMRGGLWLRDDVTALQANGSTSAASYIAAEKLRINVAGIATPEIEFQFRGDSRVEVYFNRFITKNEFQARGNIKVGLNGVKDNTTFSTIYAPFGPMLIRGQNSTLTIEATGGIKLNAPGASTDAGCGIAGTLGLWEGIVSVCGTDTKWAKITGYAGSAIDTPSNPNLLL